MTLITKIFTEQSQSPFDPMYVFNFARQCYTQFSNDNYDSNDLYDMHGTLAQEDERLLYLTACSKYPDIRHRVRLKHFNDRRLAFKVNEQTYLNKLLRLIDFVNRLQPNANLNGAHETVQKMYDNNNIYINRTAVEDTCFSTRHKTPSQINTVINHYKSNAHRPLFLNSNNPEDGVHILDETIGALTYSIQKTCDLKVFEQIETMAFYSSLAKRNLVSRDELDVVKKSVKDQLDDIIYAHYFQSNILNNVSHDMLGAFWKISTNRQYQAINRKIN